MGGTVERFLEQTGSPTTPQARPQGPTQTEQLLSDSATQQQLGLAAGAGFAQDPQKAARVLRLQAKTGLPRDLIERNLDTIEAAAASKDFDPSAFTKSSPLVAQWLAEDPSHVAVAGQDLQKLNYLERQVKHIGQQFQSGRQTMTLADIGWSAINGTVTPQQRQQQAEIEREQANQADYGIHGFFEGIPGAVANQLPILVNTYVGKVKGAIFGAGTAGLAGASAGAAVGAAGGPEGAAIGAEVGARSGLETGAKLGWKYGAAVANAKLGASLAYLDFEKLRDENGNPLDRKLMLGAAGVVGAVNGLLEMVKFEKMTEMAPSFGPQQMKRILQTPTGRAAVTRVLKSAGESMIVGGMTGFLQSAIQGSSGQLITAINDGTINTMSPTQLVDKLFSPQVMDEALANAKMGAQGGLGVSAAMGSVELHENFNQIKEAQQRKQFFQSIGSTVENAELTKTLPEKMQEVIGRITQNGPVDHVYAPIDTWNEYWQSQKIDPVAAAKEVLGEDITPYTEAQQTGADIRIPTDRYAVTIAPSEHNKFFMDELRLAPDQLNNREAQELKGKLAEADRLAQARDAKVNEGGDAVFEDVQSQLMDKAGFSEDIAKNYAELYRRTFVSLASRTGLDPLELYKGYNLDISREGITPAEVQAAADDINENTLEQRAYHGSPHEFEKFTLQKIGTGEGAQAFGWGLYFAGDKQLAQHYRDVLTARRGPQFHALSDQENAAIPSQIRDTIRRQPDFAEQILETAKKRHKQYEGMPPASVSVNLGMNLKAHAKMIAALEKIVGSERTMFGDYKNSKPKGRFFKVEIPDDHNMIHWDETPKDQPEVVKKFLEDSGFENFIEMNADLLGRNPSGEDIYTTLQEWIKEGEARNELPSEVFKTVMGYDRDNPPKGWTTDQVVEHELAQFDTRADEITSRWLNSVGIKGIKYLDGQSRARGSGSYNYVVFDDNAIKVIDYNQRELPPGFTSKAEQLIMEKMPKQASVQDIKNILAGAKPDEVKWLGINHYLDGYLSKSGDKLSKETVLDVLRANRLNIVETRFGEGGNAMTEDQRMEAVHAKADDMIAEAAHEYANRGNSFKGADGKWYFKLDYNDAESIYGADDPARQIGPFETQAQLKREIHIHISDEIYENSLDDYLENAEEAIDRNAGETGQTTYAEYTLPGGEEPEANYREITYSLPDIAPGFESHAFKSVKGILGWTRVTDRTTVDGKKLLFIEEIQSDWHQWGRERGYLSDENTAALKLAAQQANDAFNLFIEEMDKKYQTHEGSYRNWWDKGTPEEKKKYRELRKQILDAAEAAQNAWNAVPDGPFKKTWHEFVMKRLIRQAAEEGYDGIGWTTGDQQNERWGLEKHYSVLSYSPDDNTLVARRVGFEWGDTMLYPKEDLPGVIGHELTAKLLAQPLDQLGRHTLAGEDLRTGGEGMRGFYDNMLVKFAKSFGQKYLTTPTMEQISLTDDNMLEIRRGALTEEEATANPELLERDYEEVHALPLSPEIKQAALNNAFPLFHEENSDEPLGRIRIKEDGSAINIELLQKANLSTFLHETGHFYLEVLDDQGSEGTANEQLRADRSIIRSWLGAGETGPFTREQHEQFARAFEQYLMEGKAPTSGLRQAFARFRAWLVALYKRTSELHVPLTDEVRGVFDRLLATDEELAAAADEQHAEPLFPDPEKAGMTPEQAAKYSAAVEDARATAEEELTARMMQDVNREKTAMWKAERENMRTQVVQEVNQDPFWKALALLSRGTQPDGSPLPENMEPFKLSKTSLQAYFGDDIIKQLPRPFVFSKEGGLHPDIAADILGFKSGADLVGQLVMNGQQSAKQFIESETDRRMKQTQGDLLEDGRTPVEAQKALHNEKRAQLLQKELQHLASNNLPALKGLIRRIAKPLPPLEAVRRDAQDTIAQKFVRDVRPGEYQKAEARAAREATEALLKGDVDLAFEKKQQQLYNHELYVAATKAQDTVDGVLSYMAKFNKKAVRDKLAKAGGSYLAQIDAIRSRFDFTKSVTLKALAERESLLSFVQQQHALGYTISVPESLINEAYRQSFKNTSIEELTGIRDAVKQIEHLAKLKNTLLASKRARDLDLAVSTMVGEIGVHHDVAAEPHDFNPNFTKRFGAKVKSIVAAHMKPEFIFEWLDGNKEQGPVWSHLFEPLIQAENDENVMMRNSTTAMRDIFGAYTKNERALWFWKKLKVDGIDSDLTKSNILAVALNWGNKYNREALMRGYGWDEAQVEKIFKHMDARDWQTVQRIWDHLDTYWPQIAQLEKDLNGLAPEKVQADPVETPYGTFKGGYYPVVFDGNLSWRQAVQDSMKSTQELFGGQWARAMTRHGHTEERTNTGGKPVVLDLSALTDHIANVTHDLSHRRAIIDINKMIEHPDLRKAIENSIGKEMYKQLHPWLVNVAGDRRADYVNPIEGLLGRARLGATVVNLGWKMTTAVTQFLSYTNTIKEIGPQYASRGIAAVYGKPWKFKSTWNFVTERSEFMKDRIENYDRDVRDALKRMNVAGTKVGPMSVVGFHTAGVRESFFTFIGLMDMGASLPSWMGAYQRAMEGNVEQINKGDENAAVLYADKVVRTTQGVGNAKDLAGVQRGSEVYKSFTMFYSYFSVLFNQFAKTQHQLSIDKNVPRYVASLALLWFMPAAMQAAVVGRGPDPDGEPEDWMKWLAKNELTYPFQSVILIRDIINGMGDYGYQPSAAFDIFDKLSKTGKAIIDKGVNDKDFTRTDTQNAVQAVGYATKLPTKQLWLTLSYLYDWMTGNESPDNPLEGIYHATISHPTRRP